MFICQNCEAEYPRWQGRCESCDEWNTIVEQGDLGNDTKKLLGGSQLNNSKAYKKIKKISDKIKPKTLKQIQKQKISQISTEIPELDRVLGKGLMPGSIVLLTGEPGVGKSTLLVDLAMKLANKDKSSKVMYVSAEENIEQIGERAKRVSQNAKLSSYFFNTSSLEVILDKMSQKNSADFWIIDSIQTISSIDSRGIAGGIAQIKYCASEITSRAKQLKKTIFIVGHINKEGSIAGPKVLEHLVDVVLYFSGEKDSLLRLLRAEKNRFGSTDEVGIFVMKENGLISITNPGEFFLEGEQNIEKNKNLQEKKGLSHNTNNVDAQIGACRSIVLEGKRPIIVEVQSLAVKTDFAYPKRVSEGISLSRLQMICALLSKYLKVNVHSYDIYINVARGMKVTDRGVDLAVLISIFSSIKTKLIKRNTIAFGEISLSGKVNDPSFSRKREKEARNLGYQNIYSSKNLVYIQDIQFGKFI